MKEFFDLKLGIMIMDAYEKKILELWNLWKLNPKKRKITLTKLLVKHAKLKPKETEIGA